MIRINPLRRESLSAVLEQEPALAPSLISVQVGVPRVVVRGGEEVATGIFKVSVQKRVQMRACNLDGDRQADLVNHGGRDKAVYAYPSEHYVFWKSELPGMELPWGSFGENLTVAGLLEADVCLGDRFQIGTAEVVVTQPRIPCFKLNLKFQRDDMARRFLASRRTGFYLRVLREGEVGAGDEIVRLHRDGNRVSIADAMKFYLGDPDSDKLREAALRVEHLSEAWREEFSQG
jgi:MOSC domain-containing protein YiiM